MKNIIYILVDALSYNNHGKTIYRNSCTPFIDSLALKGVEFRNMYSLAPYTEGAFISSLAGERTLENGGYLKGVANCRELLAERLKSMGYATYSTYSPYIYSDSYLRGIDEFVYSRIYNFKILMDYRMTYFRDRHFAKNMSDCEYLDCADLLEEGIKTWKTQLDHIMNHHTSAELIKNVNVIDEKIQDNINELDLQLKRMKENKKEYIVQLFNQWEDHVLLSINTASLDKSVRCSVEKYVQSHYLKDLRKMDEIIFHYNHKNNRMGIGYLGNLIRNDGIRKAKLTLKRYGGEWDNASLAETVIHGEGETKVTVSAKKQLDYFRKIIENHEKKVPFYMFIHLEDFHSPSMFYSYDIEDFSLIDHQIAKAKEFVENLGDNYKGNIRADLSALYVDSLIKDFFLGLDENVRENTILAIAADHGFPFNYNPSRPTIGNDFYLENYHIPFILSGGDIKKKAIKDVVPSTQIYQLIIHMAENNPFEYEKCEKSVIIEHMGGGCPDIYNKAINYLIIDNEYAIGLKCGLSEMVDDDKIECIYNIDCDMNQLYNIKRKRKNAHIQKMLAEVSERHVFLRQKFLGGL